MYSGTVSSDVTLHPLSGRCLYAREPYLSRTNHVTVFMKRSTEPAKACQRLARSQQNRQAPPQNADQMGNVGQSDQVEVPMSDGAIASTTCGNGTVDLRPRSKAID